MLKLKLKLMICVGALLLAGTEVVFAQAQLNRATPSTNAASDKSQFEFDFWRSTERIDTPAAYAAYLETFPNGRFAALARAAISKGQVPVNKEPVLASKEPQLTLKPQALPAETKQVSQGKLAAYSEETNTGSIDLRAGDKLVGPITYMVGGIGAKKQILIPKGEWVVLAATDHIVTIPYLTVAGSQRVKQASIALAQFDGERAVSFLVFEYSRTAIPVPVNAWPDAVKCERSETASIFLLKEGNFTLQRCSAVNSVLNNRLRESAFAVVSGNSISSHQFLYTTKNRISGFPGLIARRQQLTVSGANR
jgi:hypothetical protein